MKLTQSLELVRRKCLEEQRDIKFGENANKYKSACIDYPAMMIIAHHLWAIELSKNNNELNSLSCSGNKIKAQVKKR